MTDRITQQSIVTKAMLRSESLASPTVLLCSLPFLHKLLNQSSPVQRRPPIVRLLPFLVDCFHEEQFQSRLSSGDGGQVLEKKLRLEVELITGWVGSFILHARAIFGAIRDPRSRSEIQVCSGYLRYIIQQTHTGYGIRTHGILALILKRPLYV